MIKTRIAPSPTGTLHTGTARTALFNWLYARKHSGKFVLRIEDTDIERSRPEYEEDITESLKWLGLDWDEQYRQSERFEIYRQYAEKLFSSGKARKEGNAIILNQPNNKISFTDTIRGQISFEPDKIGELVLIKSNGTPTYNFAAAVDDNEMKITHVIRGEDHISNTPKQIMVGEHLGFKMPQYAHIPLILAPDRSKLSKRHGAESVGEYKKMGYLPEAMINFMALLGWNPGTEQEIFTQEELINLFKLEKIQRSGAVFNIEKLDWMNQYYIQALQLKELKEKILEYAKEYLKETDQNIITDTFVSVVQPRIKRLEEVKKDLVWFKKPEYEASMLIWKDASKEKILENFLETKKFLESIDSQNFNIEELNRILMPLADKLGRGETLWPLRVALSGAQKSPSPFELLALLGKNESIERINMAVNKLS